MSLPRVARQGVAQGAHLDGVAQRRAWYATRLSVSMHRMSKDLRSMATLHSNVRAGPHSGQASACWLWLFEIYQQLIHVPSPWLPIPVPCTLTSAMSAACRCATASVERTRALCAGPLGAVRPLERPAWLTAEPAENTSTMLCITLT